MFTQIHPELAALLPASLASACESSCYAKGERLFSTGARPAHMFFVNQGEVILERMGVQGKAVILQRVRRGFISEASLQSNRYHCDGLTVQTSDITRVPIKHIRSALDADPTFAKRWITMLNSEVKRLRLQCERLSLNKVQDRLLHLLETDGQQGSYRLNSGLKSLASELGVTHEALYRCVAEMQKKGRLSRQDGALQLLAS
jgi:CRP-like cAMP-binding protein